MKYKKYILNLGIPTMGDNDSYTTFGAFYTVVKAQS